jgi:hypothetical protein
MEKLICLVIPVYFRRNQDHNLEQILHNELRFDSTEMHFATQPQAALAFCTKGEREKINIGDLLTVCHMEEEATVRRHQFL